MNTATGFPLISVGKELAKHTKYLKKSVNTSSKGERFQDEFGLFLSYLSPLELSSHPFFLDLRCGKKYQVDVLGVFPETIVTAECKEGESHNISDDLNKVKSYCGEVANLVRKNIDNGMSCNVVFILAYSDKSPSRTDFILAEGYGIKLIDRKILDSYLLLSRNLKYSARDIVFSDWLKGKEIRSLPSSEKIIPAMRSRFGRTECFSFLASPYLLKKLCYVNRRYVQHTLDKKGVSYQRLIKPQKIKSIRKYLEGGQFFPTSVLLNFERGLEFVPAEEKKTQMTKANPNITNGYVQPPKKHGCAAVIDGQHRIFGYSGLEDLSKEHSLSVIAFKGLKYDIQAKMFADINETQTPIDKDVLWDLYEDILPDDEDKFKLSILAKELNKRSGFFLDKVFIPSISSKSKKNYPLGINSFCRTLSFYPSLFKKVLDRNEDTYYMVLDKYFGYFLKNPSLKTDWNEKETSFLLSNNGFEIMILVLNYFYDYLIKSYIDIKNTPTTSLLEKLDEFSQTITKSLLSVGLQHLRDSLKRSSIPARKEVRNRILEEAGKFSPIFQKIAAAIYLQDIKEDFHNELKETLYFDIKKNAYSDDYFFEAILGSISSWINAQKEGNLFIGISDKNKISGLDFELEDYFRNDLDEIKKFIENRIESNLFTKDFDKNAIEISIYLEKPLVLRIHVPENEKGVAIVGYQKEGKKIHLAYKKGSTGKRRIKDYAVELKAERGANLGTLIENYLRY